MTIRKPIDNLKVGDRFYTNGGDIAVVTGLRSQNIFIAKLKKEEVDGWIYIMNGYWCGRESDEEYFRHLKYPFKRVWIVSKYEI